MDKQSKTTETNFQKSAQGKNSGGGQNFKTKMFSNTGILLP
jgi:hypothetical protein